MKKYYLMIIASALIVLMVNCCTVPETETVFYVSPDGNDSNQGSSINKSYATLIRARDAVRELKKKGPLKKPVTVYIRGGSYELSETLVLKPGDSGTETCPVTYCAYRDEKPVISGGRRITGWKKGDNGLWIAEIPDVKEGDWKFRQLYVNGESRPRAYLPKKGFYRVAGTPDGGVEIHYYTNSRRFEYARGDIDPAWTNIGDVEIIVYHFWTDCHLHIKDINEENRIVTFTHHSQKRLTDDFSSDGARYRVENVFEALTEEGEWYLNRKTCKLYYKPMPGEDIETAVIIAPYIPRFIRMEGSPMEQKYVEHLSFDGLTFMYTNWDLPPDDAGDLQAASTVPGAIFVSGARYCSIRDCVIKNVGTYGIQLEDGCRFNSFTGNELSYLGGGGIRITGGAAGSHPLIRTGHNVFSDNHIHHCGEVFPSAVGFWLAHTDGNIVSHNYIHHTYYTGISVGWNWGYGPSISRDNVIEYNHIHDIGQGLLSDMGGIYLLGIAPGTVVRNNLVHHIVSYGYGGWGIYTDEGSTHVLIENNIVYKTKWAGFNQHYGRENLVKNNVFAMAENAQLSRGRMEPHTSFYFKNNIVYWEKGLLLAQNWNDETYDHYFTPYSKPRPVSSTFEMDYNLYFNPNIPADSLMFSKWTFKEWQKRGKDIHSLIADPLFVNPEKFDFTLKPESPAFSLGFTQIDMSTVGPRKKL